MNSIAASCIDLDSEFLFMASPSGECVGSLSRENLLKPAFNNVFNVGFLLTFGYSEKMEKAVILSLTTLESARVLEAGITYCSMWSDEKFKGSEKIIAITSREPFYDCKEYIKGLADILYQFKTILKAPRLSYYAEKFGYERFSVVYENDDPYSIRISQMLAEMQHDSTKEVTGGSSQIDFPEFLGMAVTFNAG